MQATQAMQRYRSGKISVIMPPMTTQPILSTSHPEALTEPNPYRIRGDKIRDKAPPLLPYT
jgi:hypothetical protein